MPVDTLVERQARKHALRLWTAELDGLAARETDEQREVPRDHDHAVLAGAEFNLDVPSHTSPRSCLRLRRRAVVRIAAPLLAGGAVFFEAQREAVAAGVIACERRREVVVGDRR